MRKPDDAPEREGSEPFLSRWARKKEEARQAPPPAKQEADAKSPAPELPPVESLTPDSDYRAFFHPKVNEDVRRAALKKLFSDPRFNVMDGLDTYIDDYSKEDPIPPAMLRALNQARTLGLFEKEEREEEERKKAEGSTTEPTPAATPTETAALEQPAEPPSVEPIAPSPTEQMTKTPGT